jgi:CelD/BcsL family acetyltransferase involved in cellulose biosynthesis
MTGLVVELQRGAAALQALVPDWQRLWQAQPRREVFTGPAWSLAAWRADGAGEQVCMLVVRRGTTVVGLLPLATRPARFLSGINADYNDMLVCDGAPAQVVAAALQAVLANFDRCVFDNVPEWSTLAMQLPALPAALRRHIVVEAGQPCPALRLGAERETLLAAMIGKQSLKRHEKKLARHGVLRLLHLASREAIAERLDDFYAQHVSRRALAGGYSLFLQPRARAFYQQLLVHFDPAAELRFAVLEVDGRAVAYHLGFELDGRFTWYKPSFDVDYWDCGVGEVLLKRLLEYLRDQHLAEFDFTRGDESFKDRFSNHQGHNQRWTLQRSTGSAWRAAQQARLRGAVKSHPAVQAARGRLEQMMARCRPLPGSRPGQAPRQGFRAALAGWHRLLWCSEAVVLLQADAGRLPAPNAAGDEQGLRIEQGSVRQLAQHSVAPGSPFDLDDLRQAHAALQKDDHILLARQGSSLVAAAWVGSRTQAIAAAAWPNLPDLPLPEPAAVLQFVGNAWPPPHAQAWAGLLAAAAAATAHDSLWVACPAAAADHLRLLQSAGFTVRQRLHAKAALGGAWRWHGQGTGAQPA